MKELSENVKKYQLALEFARKEDYEKYIRVIRELAEKGFKPAQMCMGVACFQGVGPIQKDYFQSLKWHEKAISDELPENYYWLSLLYDPQLDNGSDLPFKNKSKSDYYLKRALVAMERKAKSGDEQSMYRVGELYSISGSVVYDREKADYWFGKWREASKPKTR